MTVANDLAGHDVVEEARRRLAAGDAQGAFRALRACAVEHPTYAPAYVEAARLLVSRGDNGGATQLLSDAMGRVDAAGRGTVAAELAVFLGRIAVSAWHPRLEADILACLMEEAVDPQGLTRPAAELILLKHPRSGLAVEAVAEDELVRVFLSRCLNLSPEMEDWIEALRDCAARAVCEDAVSDAVRSLICALGLQAFANEYLIAPGPAEREAVRLARERGAEADAVLIEALAGPLLDLTPLDAAVRAEIARIGDDGLGEGVGALLLRRTLDDGLEERRLAADLPALMPDAAATDAVSAAVRDQYEANPYPRWLSPPPVRGVRLAQVLGALPGSNGSAPQVRSLLVAGCGTGFEAIDMARMEPDVRITAVDLSRASLAYGQRMAGRLAVDAIDFRQGDVLDLPRTGLRFDMALCTGVLHHMADAEAGLAALRAVVKPGGLIRLALYSHRARQAVVAGRDLIAAWALEPTLDGVRAFRRAVRAAPPKSMLGSLTGSDDLYSTSGCRDLVFHVHERWFTPVQLAGLLAGQGLETVGFDAPPPALAAFRSAFGPNADVLDMGLWDRLEQERPMLFAGMYAVWCRVPPE